VAAAVCNSHVFCFILYSPNHFHLHFFFSICFSSSDLYIEAGGAPAKKKKSTAFQTISSTHKVYSHAVLARQPAAMFLHPGLLLFEVELPTLIPFSLIFIPSLVVFSNDSSPLFFILPLFSTFTTCPTTYLPRFSLTPLL
jgi:hypothetical protein